jgi:hypothetical protein
MAKNKVEIDVKVDDKGSTKKVGLGAKKASEGLDATAKSSRTADRNVKGLAQTASAGGKNFSKMAQGISGGLVPAYAVLAANIFALSAAFNFLKNASDIGVLEKAQVTAAENTGIAMGRLTTGLREASKGMLDFQQAAQASAIGVAKGFSPSQMEKLADGAIKVSNVLGRDFTDAFDRLVRGVSKAEPELLDELGITLRLETATKNYADSLNKSADALTDAERSQAVYLETMRQLDIVTAGQEGNVNPFVKLGVTFSDLVKNITQFFLPALEGIANLVNKNAAVALLFFGTIAASIIKSLPFIDTIKGKFGAFLFSQKRGVVEAKRALEDYRKKLEEVKRTAAERAAAGAKALQKGAGAALAQGATSPVLERAARGEMKGPDKSNLARALKSAEAQYAKSGKITTGIFKGVSIEIVRDMKKGFDDVARASKQRMGFVERNIKGLGLRAKMVASSIKVGFTQAFALAGKAASGFGKAMNAAMKATVILGIIQMLYDMTMALINSPYTIIKGIVSVGKGALNVVQGLSNMVIDVLNYIIKQVQKIPGFGDLETLNAATFATDINAGIDDYVESIGKVQEAKAWEEERAAAQRYTETLNKVKDEIPEVEKALNNILSGKYFDKSREDFEDNVFAQSKAAANALTTSGIDKLFEEALTIKDPEKQKRAIQLIGEGLSDEIAQLSPQFAAAVKSGNAEAVRTLTAQALSFTANVNDVEEKIRNMSQLVKSQGSAEGVRLFLTNLANTGKTAEEMGDALGLSTDVVAQLNKEFENKGGIDAYIASLRAVELETQAIANARTNLEIAKLNKGPGAVGAQQSLQFAAQDAELALREKLNQLADEKTLLFEEGSKEELEHLNRVKMLEEEIRLGKEKVEVARHDMTEMGQLGNTIGESLASSMQSAFNGLIQGTMNAKQAFASMAKSILANIAKIISELLVAKLLTAALGGTSFGTFLGIGARTGGMFEPAPGYATGGIARGRDAGYPAILHGTEAVVPLPNGKSIPVEMKNGGGQTNNVVVNVNMESGGGAQQNSQRQGGQGENLGKAIALAVQQELQNQKRSGGILNPYGAA